MLLGFVIVKDSIPAPSPQSIVVLGWPNPIRWVRNWTVWSAPLGTTIFKAKEDSSTKEGAI